MRCHKGTYCLYLEKCRVKITYRIIGNSGSPECTGALFCQADSSFHGTGPARTFSFIWRTNSPDLSLLYVEFFCSMLCMMMICFLEGNRNVLELPLSCLEWGAELWLGSMPASSSACSHSACRSWKICRSGLAAVELCLISLSSSPA